MMLREEASGENGKKGEWEWRVAWRKDMRVGIERKEEREGYYGRGLRKGEGGW